VELLGYNALKNFIDSKAYSTYTDDSNFYQSEFRPPILKKDTLESNLIESKAIYIPEFFTESKGHVHPTADHPVVYFYTKHFPKA